MTRHCLPETGHEQLPSFHEIACKLDDSVINAQLQGLGSAFAMLGRQREASRLFLSCARLAPSAGAASGPFVECLMSASAVLHETGQLEAAISTLSRAFRLLQPPLGLLPTAPSLASLPSALSLPLTLPLAPALASAPFPPHPSKLPAPWDVWLADSRARVCVLELTHLLATVGDFRWANLVPLLHRALEADLQQSPLQVPPKAVNAVLFLPVGDDLVVPLMTALSLQAEAASLRGREALLHAARRAAGLNAGLQGLKGRVPTVVSLDPFSSCVGVSVSALVGESMWLGACRRVRALVSTCPCHAEAPARVQVPQGRIKNV